jgi:hypothetical protein
VHGNHDEHLPANEKVRSRVASTVDMDGGPAGVRAILLMEDIFNLKGSTAKRRPHAWARRRLRSSRGS